MAASQLFSQQFGQGATAGDADLDAMVARNIQEVLQAAQLQDEPSTSLLDAPSTSAGALKPSSSLKRTSSHRAGTQAQAGAAAARGSTPPSASGPRALPLAAVAAIAAPADGEGAGATTTALLDVPGHAEATIRLHKARIRVLEEEQSKLVKALAERDRALSDSQKELKGIKAEQQTWSKDKKAYEAQVEHLQRKVADLESSLASKEQAAKQVSHESARLERERRHAEQETKARDVRLQRALEEVERYKAMLGELKSQERESKDVARADVTRLTSENKRLERQRGELLVAFKKQLRLIDVLKRQRVHLEAARALQFSEAEFLQTLELGNE